MLLFSFSSLLLSSSGNGICFGHDARLQLVLELGDGAGAVVHNEGGGVRVVAHVLFLRGVCVCFEGGGEEREWMSKYVGFGKRFCFRRAEAAREISREGSVYSLQANTH